MVTDVDSLQWLRPVDKRQTHTQSLQGIVCYTKRTQDKINKQYDFKAAISVPIEPIFFSFYPIEPHSIENFPLIKNSSIQ
jgi:hypothetical protein